MSSLKQIEANRHNALKSTGPTTLEGKQRSRCNAIRHGLTAETVIPGLEDSEDYKAFECAVIADYDAESAVERELVLRLASVLWRLRRATGIESGLFESVIGGTHKPEQPRLSRESLGEVTNLAERQRLSLTNDSPAAEANEPSSNSKRILRTASCASQIYRLSPSIVSAATNTCYGAGHGNPRALLLLPHRGAERRWLADTPRKKAILSTQAKGREGPLTDLEHWGVIERWSYPDNGYGDCEDYVLLKRRILIQSGWPREALLVTVVRDKGNKAHAVLTVTTRLVCNHGSQSPRASSTHQVS